MTAHTAPAEFAIATTNGTTTTTNTTTGTTTGTRTRPLLRTGALAGSAAAVATTAVAAAALAADVPLEIDGEQIPLLGFPQLTLMATVIGMLLAFAFTRWSAAPRRAFTVGTLALTALSFVPDVIADATTATKVVLIATHVVAAAIVIPAVARRVPVDRR